jgi:hypothetical protein
MSMKLFFLILFSTIAVFSACDEEIDPCKAIGDQCGKGACLEGTCICDNGYEPDSAGYCILSWSQKFVGPYYGKEVCLSGSFPLSSPVVITKYVGSPDRVYIANFAGYGTEIDGIVVRETDTDISAIKLNFDDTDSAGRRFAGTALLRNGELKGTYTVTFPDNNSEECAFVYTK